MQCPNCHASCLAEDSFCRQCGTELTAPSTSLVPSHSNLPAVLHNPQLPRMAAGVGAVAFGFGLELLRRGLLARLTRGARASNKLQPISTINGLREALSPQSDKPIKLPKGYEIQETAIYISRVIRRID